MPKVERSITINAPVEKVFTYVADPMNMPEWLPSLIYVHDVSGSGVGQRYKWTYNMAGVRLEGETEITEDIPNERRATETKGGVSSKWTYSFEPYEGGTKFNLEVDYSIPVPVLGKLAEKLVLKRNEREADLAMANIKDKMEG